VFEKLGLKSLINSLSVVEIDDVSNPYLVEEFKDKDETDEDGDIDIEDDDKEEIAIVVVADVDKFLTIVLVLPHLIVSILISA